MITKRLALLTGLSVAVTACSGSDEDHDATTDDVDAADAGDLGDDHDHGDAVDADPDAATDADATGGDAEADEAPPARFGVPLLQDSPWPKFRANEAQTGRVDFVPNDDGRAPWTFPTGKGIFSTPVVGADGTVYVGSASRSFYAIDGQTGEQKWAFPTGEIIDSSALLDDRGHVYFGSGDGYLYALEAASGDEVWRFQADDPSVNGALIRWFEGNVAIGTDGTLYVPNDNFYVYAIDRDDGVPVWRFRMRDQTWSLPAVDVDTGDLYIGNNNLLEFAGGNTFAISAGGTRKWEQSTRGSIAASPALIPDGPMVVGGFDGYVRALSRDDGETSWEFPTLDHVYASPAVGDGIVVQPSADGTIYGIDAATGAQRWAFDWGAPIRSSPALDADGKVYVGTGDGHLVVLNADGSFRWAIRLIPGDRNDVNASPALGYHAIYIAGESGEVFGIPADYCLRDGLDDARCRTTHTEPDDGASILFTTRFGTLAADPPPAIQANDALAFTLQVRDAGDAVLALIDETSLAVTSNPEGAFEVAVSGDRRFLTVVPDPLFPANDADEVTFTITGDYLVDPERSGLAFSGGVRGGTFSDSFTFLVDAPDAIAGGVPVPDGGSDQLVWEMSRLAAPLPTLLPSYNQIGFDSLHFLIGVVDEIEPDIYLGWLMEGVPGDDGETVPKVDTRGFFPVVIERHGDLFTISNENGLALEVMSATLDFETFRLSASVGEDWAATQPMTVHATTECGGIQLYGPFLRRLGLCNPETDLLIAYGAALLTPWDTGFAMTPLESFGGYNDVDGKLVVEFETPTLDPSAHAIALLMADSRGYPISVDYGADLVRNLDESGLVRSLELPLPEGSDLYHFYVLVDTYPVWHFELD